MIRGLIALSTIVASAAMLSAQVQVPSPAQAPPTFRSGATLVPVDVRVLDDRGKPVTDLTQKDFTLFENGVAQTITHFNQHTLTSTAPPAAGQAALRQTASDAALSPQNQRIFLLLMGRGRLQPPAKGVDAVIQMVKDRMLPQDAVAVMAWNRATDFTTNRDQILGVLQRFKDRHEEIDAKLKHHFSGMQAMYGTNEIPVKIQALIDSVFDTHGGVATRTPQQVNAGAAGLGGTAAQNAEILDRRELSAERRPQDQRPEAVAPVATLDMKFDEYVAVNRQSMQDVNNLYTGIEYLRYIEGEKHLVFVTEFGTFLPSSDDDEGLAAMANDARVAIDTIHTSGNGGGGPGFGRAFAIASLRDISRLTGGQSSAYQYASKAVDRIDVTTRSSYLLGYYPTTATNDGKYRKVTVKVNRPGVTVLYRHGFYGRDNMAPLDRRKALSYARISTAGGSNYQARDLKIDLKAQAYIEKDSGRGITAEIKVDAARVTFTQVNGEHLATLHVAVFCGDGRERLVGQRWRDIDLNFPPELYQQFLKDGLGIVIKVPTTSFPTFVKAVVYDPNADLLGSTMVRIR